jgi:hypothetical protein
MPPRIDKAFKGILRKTRPEGHPKIGGGCHKVPKPPSFGKVSLKPKRGMLSPRVSHAGVVKSPVDPSFAFISFDQGMTQFMKDHLS